MDGHVLRAHEAAGGVLGVAEERADVGRVLELLQDRVGARLVHVGEHVGGVVRVEAVDERHQVGRREVLHELGALGALELRQGLRGLGVGQPVEEQAAGLVRQVPDQVGEVGAAHVLDGRQHAGAVALLDEVANLHDELVAAVGVAVALGPALGVELRVGGLAVGRGGVEGGRERGLVH